MWKKLLVIVIGGFILAEVLTGYKSVSEREQLVSMMLSDKYNEEFVVSDLKESSRFSDYYTVKAFSKQYPDIVFEATVDGKNQMTDAYVTKRLNARIAEQISVNLGILDTEYFVYVEAMIDLLPCSNANISLKEYLREFSANEFTIYVFVNRHNEKFDVPSLKKGLDNLLNGIEGINGNLALYLSDEKIIQYVQEYTAAFDNTYAEFDDMTRDYQLGNFRIENSKFSISDDIIQKVEE